MQQIVAVKQFVKTETAPLTHKKRQQNGQNLANNIAS